MAKNSLQFFQCDQIGQQFKGFGTKVAQILDTVLGFCSKAAGKNFVTKVAKLFGNFQGYFDQQNCLNKDCCDYLLGDLWGNWATF